MLLVGMPSPFKETWCEQYRDALGVPVIIGVGGTFDVLTGYVRRAPKLMQIIGMEWFWRLAMEPRKMWRRYLKTNTEFLGLAARMRRIVRQTCQELGKKAELELSGAEGEMDRTVVDRIIAPIEHMLRNALSHGIENPEQRRSAGKPESGTIKITLERESSDVVLRIVDDGAGIKLEAIRKKAIERGLMDADSDLTDNDVFSSSKLRTIAP